MDNRSISLLAFLMSYMPQAQAAPPDNCCCELNSAFSIEKFCTRNGGVCFDDESLCQTATTTTTPTTTNEPPPNCNSGANAGGPQVAMAWVSDQYANFDREWPWQNNCTSPVDPAVADSNQFKCCHDWMVDSFAGINTVSLAFLKPTEILDPATCIPDTCTAEGVRRGIPGAIEYFYDAMSLVFVSIGGVTYTESWEEVLADVTTAKDFANKVADIAEQYNVGVEIDYEESAAPRLVELEAFVREYRLRFPYSETAPTPPSFLTIDFGQGAQFMGPIANWVAHKAFNPDPGQRLLNWANAMVSGGQQSPPRDLISRWGQHIHGYSTLQTAPIAPSYLVGGIWSSGRKVQDNCVGGSLTLTQDQSLIDFINGVEPCVNECGECDKGALSDPAPFGSYSKGMLGYAYWMVGNISPRQSNTCPLGVNFEVYDTVYEGDGDCTPGFLAAANEYGIASGVDWTSRVY